MRNALLGLALLAASCTGTVSAPSSSPLACNGPSPLTAVPGFGGPGAKAGPIMFRSFSDGSVDATIRGWQPGTIQKVLILQLESAPALHVRGQRCSDGHTLRFWYRDGAPFALRRPESTPIPTEVLDTTGDSVLAIPPFEIHDPPFVTGLPGYMFFTSAGDWRIDVWDAGGTHLGSAVLRVTTQP
jgi:hypothetical protein